MQKTILILLTMVPAFAADRFKFDEHQPISHTFNANKLLVDNVSGFIHVTGYSGSEIKVQADMHFRAESVEAMGEAKRDVKLDMNQQGSFARVYLDGPFRGNNNRGERYYGYQVEVEFEIQVPMATEVILKTVNGGPVILKNTSGAFDIRNVNGAIEMDEVSGSGDINTVNGPLTARFSRNPTAACKFKTVNGKVDIYFQRSLSADFRFRTLNGDIYSDFDLSPLPAPAGEVEQKNGKYVYKSNRMTQGRSGSGGPELSFETVNGSIRLHTR